MGYPTDDEFEQARSEPFIPYGKISKSDELTTPTMSHAQLVKNLCKHETEIIKDLTPISVHMIHMVLGISGEAGELLDAVKKFAIYKKVIDMEHIIEELGDIEFYLQGFRDRLGISRDDVLQANIEKLQKRYASGNYSDQQANTRADKQ